MISADANVVELAATVRDRQGHPIHGLHASDFEVLDNNQPRQITYFREQNFRPAGGAAPAGAAKTSAAVSTEAPPVPRTIALFFDDAHASMLGIRKSAEAARQLLTDTLPREDLVGIFTSSATVTVDFTRDRKLLIDALARLDAHPLSGVHATTVCPTLAPSEAYIITEHLDPAIEDAAVGEMVGCNCFDPLSLPACTFQQRAALPSIAQSVWQQYEYQSTTALDVLLIVTRHLAAAPGERLLILMSPGFPTGGMEDRTSAVADAALRANIRIDALNSEGLVTDRGLSRKLFVLSGFMADAAKSTGGKFLHDTNDWGGSLQSFVGTPEVSYLLGFSAPGNPDGKYHSLKTRITGSDQYSVESRPGYFAASASSKRESAQQRIDRAAMTSAYHSEFPVTLQVRRRSGTVQVTIAVDAAALEFRKKEKRWVQELTFLTVLEDARGNFIAGKQSVMDMTLTSEGRAEMLHKGIRAATSFPCPQPGSYRMREIVREAVQNRIGVSSAPVDVR